MPNAFVFLSMSFTCFVVKHFCQMLLSNYLSNTNVYYLLSNVFDLSTRVSLLGFVPHGVSLHFLHIVFVSSSNASIISFAVDST